MLDLATAEYSLVGCVLIDARCLPAAREILPTAEAFASEPCRKAYAAACRLEDEDKAIDPVIVGRAAGLSNDFLMQCMDLAPTCTRAAEYAKAVLDGHQRRQLQALGEKLQTEALCAGSTADQLLTEARSTLDDLASTPGRCSVKSARDSLLDFMTFRAEVQQGKRQTIRTGFPSLDRILGGFAQGGFYVMAARPGVGKSALGIALADMMARDRRVLYVSLEMTEAELNARRVAAVSDMPCSFGMLLFQRTTEEEDAAIANACGKLYAHKLQISAVSTLTVPELELQARDRGLPGLALRRGQAAQRIRPGDPDLRGPEAPGQTPGLCGPGPVPAEPGERQRPRAGHPPQALPAALLRRHRAGQRRRSAAPPPGIRQDRDAPGGISAPAVLRGRGQEPPRPHRHGRTGLVCPGEPV